MKRCLLVGINYVGTGNDLRGCLNDVANMKTLLESRGFADIKTVLEKEATTAGIKAGLEWLIAGAVPGDVLVFHYSGHGSQLPSKNEPDGFEEIICPIDLNWTTRVITDDTLRQIFNRVPNGVNTTVILDCCHSGTALDQDASLATTKEISVGITDGEPGRYLAPPAHIVEELANRDLVDWKTEKDVNASALLIAGCHANQTSADAYINGTYQGAATASILEAVKADPSISYRGLIYKMGDFMSKNRYTQNPQLDGFSGLYDEVFTEPFGTAVVESAPVSVAPPAVVAEPTKKKSDPIVTIVVGIIVALVIFVATR